MILTVFTPTYNRAYILAQLYESLVKQTNQNFIWLLVDDGSTDATNELVTSWQAEGKIKITYIFKENGGMHTGHNTAYNHITTDASVCIDSDDFMPVDAVAHILEEWEHIKDNPKLAGMIGLDGTKEGSVLGTQFPEGLRYGKINELNQIHKVKGDKKLVLKSAVVNSFPRYPEYKDERLVPLGTLYFMIDQEYDFSLINKVLCQVEYLEDGSTRNILSQYRKNPKGFAYERQLRINGASTIPRKLKNYIHLVSSSLFAKKPRMMFQTKHAYLLLLALPLGLLLNGYIRFKTKRPS